MQLYDMQLRTQSAFVAGLPTKVRLVFMRYSALQLRARE